MDYTTAISDNGTSLNTSLLVGATKQQDLLSLSIPFYLQRVALTAVVAEKYPQLVPVTPGGEIYRYLYLWRECPSRTIEQVRPGFYPDHFFWGGGGDFPP